MSTATATQPLSLPRSASSPSTVSRKTVYTAGEETASTITLDGQERKVFTAFDSARLIRLSVRTQMAGKGVHARKMLVVTMGIILDNLQVHIQEDEGKVPHPILSEPAFAEYAQLPHRVNAQQWMSLDNLGRVVNLANFLQSDMGFRIQRHPSRPQGSNRKTSDLFQVRPITLHDQDNPRNFGAAVDSFEVSVNPDYAQGFNSFYEGLTEQMNRWVDVMNEEDEVIRAQNEDSLSKNMHFVGGAYFDDGQQRWWPRPVDIGVIAVGGKSFPLYPVSGDQLSEDVVLADIEAESKTDTPTEGATEVAEGPSEEELQDY